MSKINFPIDLVYCWCNDADPIWNAKRTKYLQEEGKIVQKLSNDCRFIDNDELKYSLRSVEKYAPWINHIYIISDHQIPDWINKTNQKITFINHEDILPEDNLPIFNSEAIETALWNIPNLSEHFLYANDDFFLGNNVYPKDFFNSKGQAIVRQIKNSKNFDKDESLYARHVRDMQQLAKETWGKKINYQLHHNIDAYIKSEFYNCIDYFKELSSATAKQRFRQNKAFLRSMIGYWMIADGKGKEKNIKKWKKKLLKIFPFLSDIVKLDSVCCSISSPKGLKRLKKQKPKMFCLNDCENATNQNRLELKYFMEELFPEKSKFER